MSLVAYDDSDESGFDSETEELFAALATKKKAPAIISGKSEQKGDDADKTPVVKSGANDRKPDSIPMPTASKSMHLPSSSHTTSINFDMKVLDKKRSQPIRITIPSLKDFEEEEPKKPRFRPSTKGSSLFSMLPAPKNVTSSASMALMPLSVSNVQKLKLIPPVLIRPNIPLKIIRESMRELKEGSSSGPLASFFFSGADDEPLPPHIETPTTMTGDSPVSSSTTAGSFNQHNQVTSSTNEIMDSRKLAGIFEAGHTGQRHPSEEELALLNAGAMRKLCGTKDRKKGPDMSEIIDVSGSSLVGNSSMILAKELSKEQPTRSFKRKSECSSMQRRKHQITYLAEQAKTQELELRNNWAQNRVTRKQTQAKYGF